jgi:nucleotide-binding universal stress UspA family protein
MDTKRSIVLAVDGSRQARAVVNYAGKLLKKDTAIRLVHIRASVPESLRDFGLDPETADITLPLSAWIVEQNTLVEQFMETAVSLLGNAGFPAASIAADIQPAQQGPARELIGIAEGGASALVIGYIGSGCGDNGGMGSVTAKVIEGLPRTPVIVVGGVRHNRRILIGFDGSASSMQAVARVADFLDPENCELVLCHVIRPLHIPSFERRKALTPKHETEWVDVRTRRIVPAISEARDLLVAAGFHPDIVTRRILTSETSRAKAISKEALQGDFGTIVLGRQGHTALGQFAFGRVTRKILHLATDRTLWIVPSLEEMRQPFIRRDND